jgi:hypothetical protein
MVSAPTTAPARHCIDSAFDAYTYYALMANDRASLLIPTSSPGIPKTLLENALE